MKTISRRTFIGNTAKGAGAVIVLSHLPAQLLAASRAMNIPVGFQTWIVKEQLSKNYSGTLKMMAALGYQLTEMCSPKGYAEIGFGPLVKMKAAEMRNIITDAGLSCPSCHYGFGELRDSLDDRIEFAQQLGLSQMVCSSFWLPETATLKDYLSSADQLNRIGEKIKAAGMQAGFHNHSMEFKVLDGELIYDALMRELDPDLVKMQFQTEVINLGFKASAYFKKYPGRFNSSHLSDWTADKKEVPIGKGIIDWKEFFAAAKTGGVQNFFVEMSLGNMRESSVFIHNMKV